MNNKVINLTLTAEELESLKVFSKAWLQVYCFMPPECILTMFVALTRIAKIHEAQLRQINNIQTSQALTVNQFSRNLEIIAAQSINRNMMR